MFRRILVATDFSKPAERALALSAQLARLSHARLTLLHVWSQPDPSYSAAAAIHTFADARRDAQEALDERAARIASDDLGVETLLRFGPAVPFVPMRGETGTLPKSV
jgi:nucleotide-binding universal stress UspA family protein